MPTPVEAVGLAIGVAQTLLALLQTSNQLREMCSMFHCEAQLQQLTATMTTITALFLDIDAKRQELTHEGRDWIQKLKDAVYDVDDLLDEFRTLGQLRKQNKDAKLRRKVREFFSRNNKFFVNFNVSREINKLTEKLAAITKDRKDFGLTDDVTKPVFVREETCSVISEIEVIGREEEKETIVSMLLPDGSPSDSKKVTFVNIVGVGGLGKTTLAQLVYNDERVEAAFEERIWVCVSEQFSPKEIFCKILGKEESNLQVASQEVRRLLKEKRYLLVLDDVWNENHKAWRDLQAYLVSDVHGSKIIVTTRSKGVARATGEDSVTHELQRLSEENSRSLFELIAFGKQRDHQVDPDLVDIGRDIVKKCANVPLSIKVVASLLHGQSKIKWEMFRSIDLAEMSDEDDENSIIMSTLMFSYYQLAPKLKCCFSFCSIFPKDHIIKKEMLINLWLAHDYLVAPNKGKESLEEVGEAYLTVLLNRCFFQDTTLDEYGDVESFKMHDLMHDLAVKVAGNESVIITPATKNQLEEKTRHLSREWGSSNLCMSDKLRSYVWLGVNSFSEGYAQYWDEVTPIISNCKRLRVLSLSGFSIRCSLPDNVGKLLHLRYLDLTLNRLEMLPKSITKLHNLQTLILRGCRDLKKLPDDIGKLVNLRTLDISDCKNLKELPENIGKLVNMRTLDISHCKNLKVLPENIGKLVNMRTLDIRYCKNLNELPEDIGKLVNMRTLDIRYCENLNELPEDIGKLVNLRTLDARCCSVLKELPEDMSKLVNLRALDISNCDKLTYMPRGMDNLTNLQRLSDFIVGGVDVKQVEGSQLEDLRALKSLGGDLNIRILNFSSHNMPRGTNRASIPKNARLKKLVIECDPYSDDDQSEVHETLVENLCPNEDICVISMFRYKGMKMPSWTTSLSRFCCLKKLWFSNLANVEYMMEIENDGAWESRTKLFFPVLENLTLWDMPKLKGWWRGLRWREMEGVAGGCLVDDNGQKHPFRVPCFPQLRDLTIKDCKSMTYFPPCPHVKEMALLRVNDALTFCMKGGPWSSNVSTSSSCLEWLKTNNARVLNNMLLTEFAGRGVIDIVLDGDKELKSMGTLREGFERVGSAVKTLTIEDCKELDIEEEEEEGMPWKYLQSISTLHLACLPKMVKLPKGLRHLTSLQSLDVCYCDNMEEVGECIGSLTSLQSLKVRCCHKLKGLPECIKYLTSLQSLTISSEQLESIPESMRHLTSLSSLEICESSDEFKEKCREPDGEYWPRISHIPHLHIWD